MSALTGELRRLEDGTAFFGQLGELAYDRDEDRVQCHLCGEWFSFLGGAHLRRTHGWTLAEYREAFHLPAGVATWSRELSLQQSAYARSQIERKNGFGEGVRVPIAPRALVRVPRWRSLAARPDLARELHPKRNPTVDDLTEIAAKSSRKLWWRCGRCGHEWEATRHPATPSWRSYSERPRPGGPWPPVGRTRWPLQQRPAQRQLRIGQPGGQPAPARTQLRDAQLAEFGRRSTPGSLMCCSPNERVAASPLDELTAREREVLTEVATGKGIAAIAALLFLTKRAVEKHINAIFMKLNLRDSEDTSRRVTAALIYLVDADPAQPAQTQPKPTTRATPIPSPAVPAS